MKKRGVNKRGQYKLVFSIFLILAIISSVLVLAVNETNQGFDIQNDTLNESLNETNVEIIFNINNTNTTEIYEENKSVGGIEDITGDVIEEIEEPEEIEPLFTIKTILNLILDKISAIKGELINIKAYLSYENETPASGKQVDFYADQFPLASEITNEEGLAEIDWDTSNVNPGIHVIRAEYSGEGDIESVVSSVEINLSEGIDEIILNETISVNVTNDTINVLNGSINGSQINPLSLSSELGNVTIIDLKRFKKELPVEIVRAADIYFASFVSEEDLKNNFKFGKGLIIENSVNKTKGYILTYYFRITSYRDNGRKSTSIYVIEVKVNKNGKVLNSAKPRERYDYLKERGI